MKLAAVTGATGLVGRHVAGELSRIGWTVRALTRTASTSIPNVDEIVRGDLLGDPLELERFCRDASAVFHCAGQLRSETSSIVSNVVGTDRICSAAMASSAHLVHTSSAGVYGVPTRAIVDESTAVAPSGLYEQTKAASEDVVREWSRRGLSSCIVRPTTVVGIDMPNDSIRTLAAAIQRGWFMHFAERESVANYILAKDLATYIVALGTSSTRGLYIANDPMPATDFLAAVTAGVGGAHRNRPRMPYRVGLAIGLAGEWLPIVPATRAGVRSLGSSVLYDASLIAKTTGLQPSGDLYSEIAAVAASALEWRR